MNSRFASGRRRGRRPVQRIERKPEEPPASHHAITGSPSTASPSHEFFFLLKRERERLQAEIQQLAQSTTEEPEAGRDEADQANELMERTNRLALKRQLEGTLAQVERALQRLEAGTYGLCERCGQLIHPERLQALPYTPLCIGCAALHPA